jgi:hypothetical protein
VHKQKIRKEIKRKIISGMKKENVVLLTFSKKEALKKLKWENPGEFEYQRKMYDVISIETDADSIRYQCLWDQKETDLNDNTKNLITKALGQHPQNKETQKRLISFFQTLYVPGHFTWNPDGQDRDYRIYPDNRFLYLSIFYEPLVPPPRLS